MIKTIQSNAVQAYKIIEKISCGNMPLPVSYKLFKLKKSLSGQFEFQISKERELIELFQPTLQEDGSWLFSSEEDKKQFVERITEIQNLEVEVDCDKPVIPLDTNLSISIEDMEVLDNFILFE